LYANTQELSLKPHIRISQTQITGNPNWPPPLPAARRYASTANDGAAPFPFPAHRNPTPYEIFHLPQTCSQNDIKARFYELVKYHHPDSSDTPQEHFKAILAAYDTLKDPLSRSAYRHRYQATMNEDRFARPAWDDWSKGKWPHERRKHPSMNYDFGWTDETGTAGFYTPNPKEAKERDRRKKRLVRTLAGVSVALYGLTAFVLHPPTGGAGEPWAAKFLGNPVKYERHEMAKKSLEEARANARVWNGPQREAARREARRVDVVKTGDGNVQTGH
jgi:hypothetical protein